MKKPEASEVARVRLSDLAREGAVATGCIFLLSLDSGGDCDNVEANIASWTCTGSTPTGTGLNTPSYGIPHSMGGPLSTCEVYRNLGFDFAALTPHHEKSCLGAGCNGDYRDDTLSWWTAPGNQGIDSAWPLDQTRVPLWNETCGFQDFVAGAGNCVSPPEDEMLSMMTGAARSSIDWWRSVARRRTN
ncbi:MAG: hypothetical protein GY725_00225 [bacterium]|nr:hypothetical protein [bacterium]